MKSNSAKILEVLMKFEGKKHWAGVSDLDECWYVKNPSYKRGECKGELRVFISAESFIVCCAAHDLTKSKNKRPYRWERFDFKFEESKK